MNWDGKDAKTQVFIKSIYLIFTYKVYRNKRLSVLCVLFETKERRDEC